MNRISFPFLYLDSSALLRSEINPNELTRKFAQKHKKEFSLLLEKAVILSNQEDQYYKGICTLITNGIISKVITCETINKNICNSDQSKTILLCGNNLNSKSANEWILWGEEISHSKFYEAAMAIADSLCIVIDENAILLNVTQTLMNYVTSKCAVFIVGNKDWNHIEGIKMISMKPVNFIEKLILQIK